MIEAAVLYGLLKAGAALAVTAAAGEFGKTAVKEAYEALKGWLTDEHHAGAVGLIARVEEKPQYAELIRAELAKPEVARDPEVARLAETLRAAIAAIPPAEEARYAVDVREGIEAARNVSFHSVEGVRARHVIAREGDATFGNIKAPPGNR